MKATGIRVSFSSLKIFSICTPIFIMAIISPAANSFFLLSCSSSVIMLICFCTLPMGALAAMSYATKRSLRGEPFSVLSFRLTLTGVPSLKKSVAQSELWSPIAMRASFSAVPLNENLPSATTVVPICSLVCRFTNMMVPPLLSQTPLTVYFTCCASTGSVAAMRTAKNRTFFIMIYIDCDIYLLLQMIDEKELFPKFAI